MATRTDRVQVLFEVGGDGKLKASLVDMGKSGEAAALGLDKAGAAQARMLSAARTAGTVLGASFVTVMGLVIKNTMEAERVDAQLEARLKSTAGAAGMTKQALDELATATARKTTFDDESVKSAEAMLLTFTKVHADVFPKAIAAITDMATAMGTDLESATLQLGKALNDPIQGVSALQRVGVSFTADQKKVIKSLVETGQEAQAQALILRELETEFGGAAQAARDTFGGAMAALKNTLDDLTEGSGGSLDGAKDAVNQLTDTLNDPDVQAGVAAIVNGIASISSEVVQGTALLANYIQKYSDIAALGGGSASVSGASNRALNNRLEAISLTKAGVRKGGLSGVLQAFYSPNSALDAGDLFKTPQELLKQLQDESTAIIREMTSRNRQELLSSGIDAGFAFVNSGGDRPPPKTGTATGKAKSAKMPDFYAATVADIKREIEEAARLDDQWQTLAATLSGPLRAAQNEHEQNLRQITELGKAVGASAADIDKAKEQEIARYNQEAEAIRARLDPTRALIQDMEFELQLLGMGNDAREREILLRRAGASATEEQRQRVDELIQQLKGARELDDTKRDLRDLFVDVGMDIGNAENAVEQFFDTLKRRALQALADNLIGKLFPQQQPGGDTGSGGGWMSILGSVFSGLFGGGRATGGSVSGGSLYEVVERGQPEVFEQNGRRYLIPGGSGWVTPAQPIGGSGAAGAGAAGGFAKVTVNNYGNPNDVRTEERTGPGGMRELLVFVQEAAVNAVAADMQKGGKVAKSGQMAFGWQRQGVVRG